MVIGVGLYFPQHVISSSHDWTSFNLSTDSQDSTTIFSSDDPDIPHDIEIFIEIDDIGGSGVLKLEFTRAVVSEGEIVNIEDSIDWVGVNNHNQEVKNVFEVILFVSATDSSEGGSAVGRYRVNDLGANTLSYDRSIDQTNEPSSQELLIILGIPPVIALFWIWLSHRSWRKI